MIPPMKEKRIGILVNGVPLVELTIVDLVRRRLRNVISVTSMVNRDILLQIAKIRLDAISVAVMIIRLPIVRRRRVKRRKTINSLKPRLVLFN